MVLTHPPECRIQGSHISIDRKPELHVDAVGVSFTGWLSHLRRAGTRCQ